MVSSKAVFLSGVAGGRGTCPILKIQIFQDGFYPLRNILFHSYLYMASDIWPH
jgi:hypothetical protein